MRLNVLSRGLYRVFLNDIGDLRGSWIELVFCLRSYLHVFLLFIHRHN